jgi:hypothetical protein
LRGDLIKQIEGWFAEHGDDGEFGYPTRDNAYSVIGPTTNCTSIIVTTKPATVSAAIGACPTPERFGMIGRYGLPQAGDASWLRTLVESHDLFFIGDLDPPDLMIFAWLRACLHPKPIAYAGVGDALLATLRTPLPEMFRIPCTPAERNGIAFMEQVFPDFRGTVGAECARSLRSGEKIEIEAVVSATGTPATVLQAVNHKV